MWEEAVVFAAAWDSCDGVNAAFHFGGKKGCLANTLI